MAYAMTKQGSLTNFITYEFICDTVADMNAIETEYRTLGSVAIVLAGESGMEVYMAGSDKEWNSLTSLGGNAAPPGLTIYICGLNEVSNGLPDVEKPDDTTLYLIPAQNETNNLYEEYVWVNDGWERFGGATLDLSGYATLQDIAGFYTKPNGGIPAADLAETYLTLHQDISGKVNNADLATVATTGSYNDLTNKPTIPDVSGFYTKPAGGIPAADLAETYLTLHQSLDEYAQKANPVFTGSISMGRAANSTVGANSTALGTAVTASGSSAHAEGDNTIASGVRAHAEGYGATASGGYSHAEGSGTTASNLGSHAEGLGAKASGEQAHAEGYATTASGNQAHAEGSGNSFSTKTISGTTYTGTGAHGVQSHAEGKETWAIGRASHAEGNSTTASGTESHAEGYGSIASSTSAHAEGSGTTASGDQSHAEGGGTTASGAQSHAEGASSVASGAQSHAEGNYTTASAQYAHSEGNTTIASGQNSHAEGDHTIAYGPVSHAEGYGGTYTFNNIQYTSHANGTADHTEGYQCLTESNMPGNHAEGYLTRATGGGAHSEGQLTLASGFVSHAEGGNTIASGLYSHAEGLGTTASALYSHAEGLNTTASGSYSHAEGAYTVASGTYAHAEGFRAQALGVSSHAEGFSTIANAAGSHVGGWYNIGDTYDTWLEWTANTVYAVGDKVKVTTISNNIPTVTGYVCRIAHTSGTTFSGTYWTSDVKQNYVEIIGNGTENERSNARALTWTGDEKLAGDVYVHCNNDSTGGTKLATETFVNTAVGAIDLSSYATVAALNALTQRVAELESEITSLRNALNLLNVPENVVTGADGTPVTDEALNYVEFDEPTT